MIVSETALNDDKAKDIAVTEVNELALKKEDNETVVLMNESVLVVDKMSNEPSNEALTKSLISPNSEVIKKEIFIHTEKKTKNLTECNKKVKGTEFETTKMQVEGISQKSLSTLSILHNMPPLNEEQLSTLRIERKDFDIALKNIQPSALREGFATVPNVKWNDIGALKHIQQELQMTIMVRINTFGT